MNAYLCLLVYIVNVGAYCWIRTYKRRCVLSNTHLRLKGGNQLFENNVNTVDLYQISRVILSSFLGIPSEFLGNRWQYYSRHLQKIHCILSIQDFQVMGLPQCFALFSQVNFLINNLNFHWRWWNQSQIILLNLFKEMR